MLRVKSFGSTDVGLLRTHNEDCFTVDDRHQLYVLADGMGGHNHGEVASRIAVDSIFDHLSDILDNDGTLPAGYDASMTRHSNCLRTSIHTAHDRVLKAIRQDGSLLGMGTTIVTALHHGAVMSIAHVGDSRGYRLRHGHLELLTQDHTWVNEQVVAGYLSEEQAKSHPLKNVVTRALGGDSDIVVDVLETSCEAGDRFLLCSDGLTTMLSDEEIHERLASEDPLEETCKRLVNDANARGGFDNVTVVILDIYEADDEDPKASDTPLISGPEIPPSMPAGLTHG